jgi:hypothetical protein
MVGTVRSAVCGKERRGRREIDVHRINGRLSFIHMNIKAIGIKPRL